MEEAQAEQVGGGTSVDAQFLNAVKGKEFGSRTSVGGPTTNIPTITFSADGKTLTYKVGDKVGQVEKAKFVRAESATKATYKVTIKATESPIHFDTRDVGAEVTVEIPGGDTDIQYTTVAMYTAEKQFLNAVKGERTNSVAVEGVNISYSWGADGRTLTHSDDGNNTDTAYTLKSVNSATSATYMKNDDNSATIDFTLEGSGITDGTGVFTFQ